MDDIFVGYTLEPLAPPKPVEPPLLPPARAGVAEGRLGGESGEDDVVWDAWLSPWLYRVGNWFIGMPGEDGDVQTRRKDDPGASLAAALLLRGRCSPEGQPEFRLIGFAPHVFLRVLGFERARAKDGPRLLATCWVQPPSVDLLDILLPKETNVWGNRTPSLLLEAIHSMAPSDEPSRRAWDARLAKWRGPWAKAEPDCWLAYHLALFLGIYVP